GDPFEFVDDVCSVDLAWDGGGDVEVSFDVEANVGAGAPSSDICQRDCCPPLRSICHVRIDASTIVCCARAGPSCDADVAAAQCRLRLPVCSHSQHVGEDLVDFVPCPTPWPAIAESAAFHMGGQRITDVSGLNARWATRVEEAFARHHRAAAPRSNVTRAQGPHLVELAVEQKEAAVTSSVRGAAANWWAQVHTVTQRLAKFRKIAQPSEAVRRDSAARLAVVCQELGRAAPRKARAALVLRDARGAPSSGEVLDWKQFRHRLHLVPRASQEALEQL
ncbi:unnamed protein product, partial [Prorocentrum cordatum]